MSNSVTDKILKQLKPRAQIQAPIGTDMFLPNLSGDHSQGIVRTTPTANVDIPNKAYVDTAASAKVSDAVYGSGWDGVTTVAPSKNAVYDKIETLGSAGANTALSNLASVAINANLTPGSSGKKLGDASLTKEWTELALDYPGTIWFGGEGSITYNSDNASILSGGHLSPLVNNAYSLGIAGIFGWSSLNFANGGFIDFNNTGIVIQQNTDTLVFSGASTGYSFDVFIDLSGIGTTTENMKIAATTSTPATTWTNGVPSTNPAGYMKIKVGANMRYIPFWT